MNNGDLIFWGFSKDFFWEFCYTVIFLLLWEKKINSECVVILGDFRRGFLVNLAIVFFLLNGSRVCSRFRFSDLELG